MDTGKACRRIRTFCRQSPSKFDLHVDRDWHGPYHDLSQLDGAEWLRNIQAASTTEKYFEEWIGEEADDPDFGSD